MWDLRSLVRDQVYNPYIGSSSFNHWTNREVSSLSLLILDLHLLLHPRYWSINCSISLLNFLYLYAGSFLLSYIYNWASQVVQVVKNSPVNAGEVRDVGSTPRLGRSPGGRYGNSLQYSCLEDLMKRGAWSATVSRVTKSQTWLKRLSMHAYI